MKFRIALASIIGSFCALGVGVASAGALTVSCMGTPAVGSVVWTASAVGGVNPVAFLWGNGSTASIQTIPSNPGLYAMTIQGTDASSTIATSTCSATVSSLVPSIVTFAATPSTITNGQSAVLSWTVNNASTTSISNGVGSPSGTSFTVMPTVTTTYVLTATNPTGASSASATVVVNATSTGGSGDRSGLIQVLLNQIAALRTQIMALISSGSTTPGQIIDRARGSSCYGIMHRLSNGSRGDEVKNLQQHLKEEGVFSSGVTGFFGPATRDAVIKYQLKLNILTSASSTGAGIVGPKTLEKMAKHCINSGDRMEGRADKEKRDN